MRVIRQVRPAKVRQTVPAGLTYGPTHGDLVRYVSHKFALNAADARLIVRAVFDYIRAEVLQNGAQFTIHGFGRFRREYIDYARNRELYEPGPPKAYMRFSEGSAARVPLRDPDDEVENDG
jgi:hypothetical protein